MNNNAIEIRNLTKSFEHFQLGPLNMTVPRGSIYAFVGMNGAGKTTTLDLIFGMGKKSDGSIHVLGYDHIRDELPMKQRVGYVSPDTNFQAWGDVASLIQFVKGFYPSWDDSYCEKLLNDFGIGRDEKISALSFGAKTKLSVVVALAWHPELLILDEPTVGVDAVSKRQIFSELLAVVQNENRTVLISSHNLSDLERFADYVGIIKNGKMVLEGAMADIIEQFRLVDFVTKNGAELKSREGFFPQKRDGNRWQVLLDARRNPIDELERDGATQISSSPVTLEDVFVALAKEEK
jgi:ABC-2 type transport system ATP-binding protein